MCAMLLVAALMFTTAGPAYAAGGQTGNISGTVQDASSHLPLANARVDAVSPTGTYRTQTDSKGFFSILGLSVDTYTITIELQGYQSVTQPGVTIQGDANLSLGTLSATKLLQTVAVVRSRSQNSAFQPSQTIDSYTVSGDRILQTAGKADATNENNLVLAVPGVTLTNAGLPTIRGGLRTEVGYQLDGVDFTEPFFAGNASNGFYNGGLGSLQVVEGAGDATQGNIGGGVINVVPKRGTYPASGDLDLEVGGPNYFHQFAFSYGFATPNGRVSDYFSFTGQRDNPYNSFGSAGSPGSNLNAAQYGDFYAPSYELNNDLSNNFVFKFGHNNSQTLSVLYENHQFNQYGNLGGIGGANYYLNDPSNPFSANSQSGLGIPNYASIIGLTPDLPGADDLVNPSSSEQVATNSTRYLKFEYDNNISATSFLQLKYYNWETLQTSENLTGTNDNQPTNLGLGSYPVVSTVGGPRVGADLTFTQQIGQHSTTTIDAKYEVSHPIWNEYDPNAEAFLLAYDAPAVGPSINDFEPGGYLSQFFPNGIPRIPVSGINYNGADYHTFGLGLREQYSPVDRLKFDVGLRFDQQIQQYGYNPLNPTEPNNPSDVNPAGLNDKYLDPHELEPRAAVNYQFGANDAVHASYGRSVVFLTGQTSGTPAGFYNYSAFNNVPAIPGFSCGTGLNPSSTATTCKNYAQQLYWLYDQNFDAPDLGGALPALYNNYDFTYNHQFKDGIGLKVTPFYKQGTNLPSFALVNSLAAGAAVFTVNNEGINKTTGVEFGLTTPEKRYGFSGFLSATYQNVIGSTPPLISGEDALPINGSGSLGLGDTYRAGYVSPVDVRIGGDYKFKNGIRINPVLEYNVGYPYSVGNTLASSCELNGKFVNLPQTNFGCGVTAIPGFQSETGATNATNYYDPAYSGTSTNPNIAATRGTPATSASGGVLSHPNLSADMTLEYKHGRNTVGISAVNLFGNIYNNAVPIINPYYQPVANGVSGTLTGLNTNGEVYTNRGFANVPKDAYAFTNGAYLLLPNAPTTIQVYYQLGL